MAVYTEVSDEQLTIFLENFDLGQPMSFKGIAEGVENTNFLLKTKTGRYILTLYEKRVDEQDLPFFLGLIDHLSAHNIICPTPIHDKTGRSLSICAGRPAALFTFLDGMSITHPTKRHTHALGKELANFHIAGRSFNQTRPNSFSIAGMKKFYQQIEGNIESIEYGLCNLIENELEYLNKNWPQNLPTGIIHADLFPDNVFFLDDKISGLIDFYFACTDYLALDLAISLNAWCFDDNNEFCNKRASAFFAAYHNVRPIEEAEIEAMPILARAAALRFLLTRTNDWLLPNDTALVAKKDPKEYIQKLKFHQSIVESHTYGLVTA